MKAILLVDKNNNVLVDYQNGEGLIDNSIEIVANDEAMVIKLKNDYIPKGNIKIKINNGKLDYITK